MKTFLMYTASGLILLLAGMLFSDNNKKVDELTTELIEADSTDKMIEFIGYVDSMNIVESVTHNYEKLKEENEVLQEEIVETKKELGQTKEKLERAEEVISSYVPDTISSDYNLLPVSSKNYN